MSYTKGPLRISGPSQGREPDDDGGNYAIIESGGIIIGEAFHCIGKDAYRDARANARLWASAPDLLDELRLIVEGWDAIESNKIRRLSDWEKERREYARAALAAATDEGDVR